MTRAPAPTTPKPPQKAREDDKKATLPSFFPILSTTGVPVGEAFGGRSHRHPAPDEAAALLHLLGNRGPAPTDTPYRRRPKGENE